MKPEFKLPTARKGRLHCQSRQAPGRRPSGLGFAKREDGSLLILGLMLFVIMSMMGGLAIDLMRYEQRRTLLQQTLDRSVLAGAAMSQKLTGQAVVTDYFAKAGLSDTLDYVDMDKGDNYRIVTATASSKLDTYFMHMIGIKEIEADGDAVAEQRVSNIEVSMVLDISGSMYGSRIDKLRPAAREFITTVLAAAEPGHVSISIVPYNAQVNVGKSIMDSFNVDDNHTSSYCIQLPTSAYLSNDISTTTKMVHNAHFDPYSSYYYYSSATSFNCSPESGNTVTAVNNNETTLHNAINNMVVGGNTSINIGVKWGAYLLNHNANAVIKNLVTAKKVIDGFSDRPMDPLTEDVLKVLIVMTDGQNTSDYVINDPYNSGLSNIYVNKKSGAVTVYFNQSGNKDWYWVSSDKFKSTLDGSTQTMSDYNQLTWPEVWAKYPVEYVAKYFYSNAVSGSSSYWEGQFRSWNYYDKDTQLQDICTAAKSQNIVIYGIGFEAPDDGRTQVRNCASSTAHYFDASGLEISTAFRAIANNITQLRLTQ
ncbi:VWA domain-containing protein [Pseudorhodobacter sp. W20_MBD10_FR17]|uniref:VWA domain-containing protein n=1 Tax=Pseudorhodobacter sp. W20_MBD10_FR17 TaxID=3240266 RepID=UPI003F9C5974